MMGSINGISFSLFMSSEFIIGFGTKKKYLSAKVDTPTFKNVKLHIAKSFPEQAVHSQSLIFTRNVLGGKCSGPLNVIVGFEDEILPSLTICVKRPECETCFLLLSLSSCITNGKCARLP